MIRQILILLFWLPSLVLGQKLSGVVRDSDGSVVGATVLLNGHEGMVTNETGEFVFIELKTGRHELKVQFIGYRTLSKTLELGERDIHLELELVPDRLGLSEVTISADRSEIERYESIVIVRAIDDRIFDQTSSVSMAEGLSFSPGLRLETNCQNCGFTQLRMNGLDGAYSQILIDNRPIFSSLAGVYGLELIPSQMIDRIEVLRGGGSAMYGGNAIAGTVNILTKEPVQPSFEIGVQQALVNGEASDRSITFNGSILSEDLKKGLTLYGLKRDREAWDANSDELTEMVELKNISVGFNAFIRPDDRSKWSMSGTFVNEYRRGGGQLERSPHQANLSEELQHDIFNAQVSYERYLNDRNKVSAYFSGQTVSRDSYYGSGGRILEPGDSLNNDDLLALNAYGSSRDITAISGVQWNWNDQEKWAISAGSEFQFNRVDDIQPAYQRELDQVVRAWGTYAQADFALSGRWSFSLGGRLDWVRIRAQYAWPNLRDVNDQGLPVFVPRASVKYNLSESWRIRGSFAQGYRAPQAFNEDLHIEVVGGEAVFNRLDPNLRPETSNSYNLSLQWAPYTTDIQLDVILEGFYTGLNDIFFTGDQQPLSDGGSVRTVRNGSGASVFGGNIEFNGAIQSDWTWQSGITIQAARYDEGETLWSPMPITDANSDSVTITSKILRTPNVYGCGTLNFNGFDHWSITLSAVYTGPMDVPHVLDGETGFTTIKRTESFLELNPKIKYHIDGTHHEHFEFYVGVFNLLNSFQSDFDSGVDRDACYVYGPSRPITYYAGIKVGLE
ncbi:MAG: TonB-dependent receptor [Flavobacteriales bacterium]|nr:TonB-dependent receptor [Flavobacteriales bacterium]